MGVILLAPMAALIAWEATPLCLVRPTRRETDDSAAIAGDAMTAMRRRAATRSPLWWLLSLGCFVVMATAVVHSSMRFFLPMVILTPLTWVPVWSQVLRPVVHLPLRSRRALFPVVGVPVVLAPSLGVLAGALIGPLGTRDVPSVVQVVSFPTRDGPPLRQIVVPSRAWRLRLGGTTEVGSGEASRFVGAPATEHSLMPGMRVENPYAVAVDAPAAVVAESLDRALRDVHGTPLGADAARQLTEGAVVELGPLVPVRDGLGGRLLPFVPILGLYAWIALFALRARQYPVMPWSARRRFWSVVVSVAFVALLVAWLLLRGAAWSVLAAVALRGVSSLPPVVDWVWFAGAAAAIWLYWRAAARRFDALELPSVLPEWHVERALRSGA